METNNSRAFKTPETADEPLTEIGRQIKAAVEMDQSDGIGQALYVIAHPHPFYKIGLSQHPGERFKQIQINCPYELQVIAFDGYRNATLAEEILHEHFSDRRVRGEWFDIHDELMALLFDENSDRSLRSIVVEDERYPGLEDGQ